MRIAITYDFQEIVNIQRDGIGVFVKFLISSLMEYSEKLELEIWTYDFNKENVKILFSDVIKKYPSRIYIFDDNNLFSKIIVSLKVLLYKMFLYAVKKKYKILRFLTKDEKYSKYIYELLMNKHSNINNYICKCKNPNNLQYNINKYSTADVVYIPYVSLSCGQSFKCPKFVQVHDLFTMHLFELFAKHWEKENVEKFNSNISKILKKYAELGSIFVSSSEFTVKEHCLKYIPGIKSSQAVAIPFPPMLKNFNEHNILSKEDFKNKYGIAEVYIAVPSQNRPNKNWSVIFRAIDFLKKKGIDIQFVTTGKVKDIKSDDLLVKTLNLENNILEIGSISEQDLYMLYKYQNIAVGSTIIEGMGISGQVLEALKVGGCPAIHSRCYGYIESLAAVGLTEETADLNWFDHDDYLTLAKKMEEVLINSQAHIEKQKHILAAYTKKTWNNVAEEYINLFKGAIYE